jgi:hypothetical protein
MTSKLNYLVTIFATIFILSACQKEIPTVPDPVVNPSDTAIFTFNGAPDNCVSPVLQGTYEAGTILDPTNFITLQVNVTRQGTYNITTGTVNGVQFSVSDSFSTAGAQTVVLTASGTPQTTGSFDFTPGPAGCTFTITFTEPPTVNDCKDCNYYPLCVGSKYTYYDTTSGVASLRDADLLSSVDTLIGGKTFKRINFNTDYGYYNCEDGVSIAAGYHVALINGVNALEFYKSTIIKANAAIGDQWSDTLTSNTGQKVIQNFKLEQKGVSRTLGAFNFTDVIVVSNETGVITPTGYSPLTRATYYFAKDVGLVEIVIARASNGQVTYHSVIKSYFIP